MWLDHEDLVFAFGQANVFRPDPAVLEGIGLSEPAWRALSEVGLPGLVGDGAFEAIEPEVVDVPGLGRFCHVGKSVNRFFSVDLSSEEVYSLAGWDLARNPSFLNSTVPAFVQCIAHYGMVQNAMPDDRSEYVSAMWAKQLRERLGAVEERCLTEKNAYFASIVDDIGLGII